jgi:hypothetical protein
MANAQAMVSSFKKEILCGSHALGAQAANATRTVTTVDVLKAALYTAAASPAITAATTAYSATGEVTNGSGTGYTATGATVTNGTAPSNSTTKSIWTPDGSLVWTAFTSAAAFDCVLIYNSSSTGKLAISSHTFGSQSITAGTFTLTMPANADGTALVQIS